MEIQSLRLLISEPEVNALVARYVHHNENIQDLRVQFSPQGIRIAGAYKMMISVPFESLWQISVAEGQLKVRLTHLRTIGLNVGLLKNYLLGVIAAKMNCLRVSGDALLLDLDLLLKDCGNSVRTHLNSVDCAEGTLTVEGSGSILGLKRTHERPNMPSPSAKNNVTA
jgi:uncharacterized membrane protein